MDASQTRCFDLAEAEEREAGARFIALTASERLRFDAVYREHRDAVMRLLRRRLGQDEDVADLMQEAYLRILRYRDCSPQSLKFLLFRTALNLATSHGIRACARLAHLPLEDVELADACSPEADVEASQRMQQMMTAANALPGRCRQVFLLRLIHGLRQQEIAQRCGISTRMVEQHLARAQRVIREQVGGSGASRS